MIKFLSWHRGARGLAWLAVLVGLASCHDLVAQVLSPPMLDRSRLAMTFEEDFASPLSLWDSKNNPSGRWKTNYYFSIQDPNAPKGWESRTLVPNGEAEFYGDPALGMDPFEWRKGELTIIGKPNPHRADPRTNGLPYLSGLITTEKSFNQTYGYFEARAALPMGKGIWPAFWLLPQPRMENGWAQAVGQQEIDIFEAIGEQGTLYFTNFSDRNGVKVPDEESRTFFTSTDLTSFNTYGVMVGPRDIVWYFNDREVRRRPNLDFHMPAYMLLNLAIGGKWPGMPDVTTPFPARFRLAWVRAYKLK
jgi:beta-glucanase (GH16 family)